VWHLLGQLNSETVAAPTEPVEEFPEAGEAHTQDSSWQAVLEDERHPDELEDLRRKEAKKWNEGDALDSSACQTEIQEHIKFDF